MSTQKDYKDPKVLSWRKVEKVLLSCKTLEQFKNGYKYYKLWLKQNSNWIPNWRNGGASFIDGHLLGIIKARIQEFGL